MKLVYISKFSLAHGPTSCSSSEKVHRSMSSCISRFSYFLAEVAAVKTVAYKALRQNRGSIRSWYLQTVHWDALVPGFRNTMFIIVEVCQKSSIIRKIYVASSPPPEWLRHFSRLLYCFERIGELSCCRLQCGKASWIYRFEDEVYFLHKTSLRNDQLTLLSVTDFVDSALSPVSATVFGEVSLIGLLWPHANIVKMLVKYGPLWSSWALWIHIAIFDFWWRKSAVLKLLIFLHSLRGIATTKVWMVRFCWRKRRRRLSPLLKPRCTPSRVVLERSWFVSMEVVLVFWRA